MSLGARERRTGLVLSIAATAIIVATEFIVIGLLPVLARDFGTSLAETGRLVSAFALSAAVLGPPLTLAVAAQPPRRVLAGILLLFAAGNLAAILFPSYGIMMAARVIQGAALPVFVSISTAIIAPLASAQRGRTLAMANTGFVLGLVVALPAGVALAQGDVWMPSFVVLALLAMAAAIAVAMKFPVAQTPTPAAAHQAALLLQPPFLCHVLLTVAVFAAMFSAYTYLAAWLEGVTGLGNRGLAMALAGFAGVGLIGNIVIARLGERAPLTATMLMLGLLSLSAIVASAAGGNWLLLVPLLGLWGAAHTASVTLCQIRVTLAGGRAASFAMAMNISAANLGIAIGAMAGGVIVERWGIQAIGWGAAALTLVTALVAGLTALTSWHGSTADPPCVGHPGRADA